MSETPETGVTVSILGAGNVGWHLAQVLYHKGLTIQQVFSRDIDKSRALAAQVNAFAINDLTQLEQGADLYIFCIKDDAIREVASMLSLGSSIVVHTSGTIPMEILQPVSTHVGVFYPLQTFSKHRWINFKEIPICIEGSNIATTEFLFGLGEILSDKVYHLDSNARAKLHLSAVFASNFSNYMYTVAAQLCEENGGDYEMLLPLIRETVGKLEEGTPLDLQTGPARRNDSGTIENHLKLLQNHPEFQQIYQLLSTQITKLYNGNS